MKKLTGSQRKYLKGKAHNLQPFVIIGQRGLSKELLKKISSNLEIHELIKIKFNDFKEEKKSILATIEKSIECEIIATIGHTAILYKENEDEEKRKIKLP